MTRDVILPGPTAARAWLNQFTFVHLDLGTGDGAFALHMARTNPDMAVLGIDTCLANLTKAVRRGLPNLRFIARDATNPPACLHGMATSASINFPYGSLLRALLDDEGDARDRLFAVAKPGACVEIRVNGSAATEMGLASDEVAGQLRRLIHAIAPGNASVTIEGYAAFRRFPSTWAKRLAYGRPSEIVVATGRLPAPVNRGVASRQPVGTAATGPRRVRPWP